MSTRLSIDALPASRRAARWREAVCETFVRLDCRLDARAAPHGLPHGTLDAETFGELRAARVTSSGQSVRRTAPAARAATEAWVLASVQLAGRTVVSQAGREAVLGPGDVAFYDTARPYRLDIPGEHDQTVLYLPRDAVERAVPGGLEHVGVRLPAGHPCARALHALAPWLLGPEDAPLRERAAAGATGLFALALDALRSPPAGGDGPSGRAGAALHRRALALIDRRLDDPELGAGALAHELGVSPRRLQEAFAARGATPSAALREARLARARALLVDPASRHEPIARIAARSGFEDPAGFSRRFRARYGWTPRACRAAAR